MTAHHLWRIALEVGWHGWPAAVAAVAAVVVVLGALARPRRALSHRPRRRITR